MYSKSRFLGMYCVFFFFTLAISSPCFSQFTWEKYQNNPVLMPDAPWEGNNLYATSILKDESVYHMWYWSGQQIGYATSQDGITWQKHENNPVLVEGGEGEWDDTGVFSPTVIYDGVTYHMWYVGRSGPSVFNDIRGFGYATSPDGVNWTKYAGNPVVTPDPGSWDQKNITNVHVVRLDSTLHMWYSGFASNAIIIQVGYASSLDGINWTKHPENPVLEAGASNTWDCMCAAVPSVIARKGFFQMWYGGANAQYVESIGYAESFDGVHWNKYTDNPVLTRGQAGEWDDYSANVPVVFFNGTEYTMWYGGLTYDGVHKGGAGIATSTPPQRDLALECLTGCIQNAPIHTNNLCTAPTVRVRNNGVGDEYNVEVMCKVDSAGIALFSNTQTIDTLRYQMLSHEIVFESWQGKTYSAGDAYSVHCYTALSGDENVSNDTMCTRIEVSNLVDDFESDFDHWQFNSGWGVSNISYHSASHCLSSTTGGNYQNNVDSWTECTYSFNLSHLDAAHIAFWTRYMIEQNHDSGYVEVSGDGGSSWHQLGRAFSGTQMQWIPVELSLNEYCGIGYDDVRLRFHFASDGTQLFPMYGWNIDDIHIFDTATPVAAANRDVLPGDYILFDNYPNPFNPWTTIQYQVPEYNKVKITIYNQLGQELRTLVNRYHSPGHFKIVWDGRDSLGNAVPSGVYVYKMETDKFRATKKMIVLK